MATITATITKVPDGGVTDVYVVQWPAMGIADTGTAVPMSGGADRSIQFAGTFGGATVVFEGSNDGTNYITLTDPQGNPISKSAAAIEAVSELTRYVRCSTSGGSGTAINATLVLKGQH